MSSSAYAVWRSHTACQYRTLRSRLCRSRTRCRQIPRQYCRSRCQYRTCRRKGLGQYRITERSPCSAASEARRTCRSTDALSAAT
eukprot:1831323-Rhodomonas_salina.2